eukprot:NODE_8938_length_1458_cov_6.129226.p1 GENE.NODE_8938_length_1458_cov_6.129226~~NODE_8938_length_1458_cov_6.129226.p1  ORF type:complete len:379 (-),score=107.47 NODE_8938_length_1458_cov_6.129226:184-1320(-)
MTAQQWVWEALAMGKERALKGVDTSQFDWRGAHPEFGSPLHAVLFGKIRDDACTESDGSAGNGDGFGDLIGDDVAEKNSRLALLRLAVERGADPDLAAPASCDVQKFWFLEKRGQRKETKSIVFAGKSAFQCLLAAERAIKMTDVADWKEDLEAIDEAIEILSNASCQRSQRSNIPVAEGVIETWENVFADTESADIVIHVEVDNQQVRVHSAVLRCASPVLKAMFSAGMREGARKAFEVKDCSTKALKLLLSLIYTGTTGAGDEEPSVALMLTALDLAHRWQVLHVVQMLALALEARIDLPSFENVMDVALRLQLPSLLSACRLFASGHAREMRQRLQTKDGTTGFRSLNVQLDVDKMLNGSSEAADAQRKRRRRTL